MEIKKIVKIIKEGGIGVIPTDTIYGLVGSALNKKTVEQIYRVRRREKNKPFIVLISSLGDLKKFHISLNSRHLTLLKKLWPGPVSVVLPLGAKRSALSKFRYLHRGKNSIALRLPQHSWLRNLLKKTGPLVAPSANIAGRKPAETVIQAKKYFGNKVDFYFESGRIRGKPSIIVEIKR